jgi:hypothetical protein
MYLLYEQKKEIADAYIGSLTDNSLGWNDLSDINSLHDAETREDIIELCIQRLKEDDYPFDTLNDE